MSIEERRSRNAARMREWMQNPENRAKQYAAVRAWNQSEHGKRVNRKRELRKRYGLDYETYEAMLAAQGGECAVCHISFETQEKAPHVDHDHNTGRVRGLLCTRCNQGLGYFLDREDLLLAAVEYLGRTR